MKSLIAFRIEVMEADNGYIVEIDVYGDHVNEPEFYRIGSDLADTVNDAVGIALGYLPPETEQITGPVGDDSDFDVPF
jgi:hypothetical protein